MFRACAHTILLEYSSNGLSNRYRFLSGLFPPASFLSGLVSYPPRFRSGLVSHPALLSRIRRCETGSFGGGPQTENRPPGTARVSRASLPQPSSLINQQPYSCFISSHTQTWLRLHLILRTGLNSCVISRPATHFGHILISGTSLTDSRFTHLARTPYSSFASRNPSYFLIRDGAGAPLRKLPETGLSQLKRAAIRRGIFFPEAKPESPPDCQNRTVKSRPVTRD